MKKISIILITISLLTAFSCGEEALEKTNKNSVSTDSYYKTQQEILAGVNAAYALLQGGNLAGREYFFLHDLRGDEMATGGGQLEPHRLQVLVGSHASANGVLTDVWTGLSRLIHRANVVITSAPEVEGADAATIDRYVGEAKFLRAWAYYQKLGFWGGVPIYTTFATSIDDAQPRATPEEVKALIVEDLTDAIAKLPASYSGADRGRATKIAAQTLLAKVYMFHGQYTEAKPLLQAVIDAGGENPLMDNYFDNFTEEGDYNKESIFEISFGPSGYSWTPDANNSGTAESWIRAQEYSPIAWRNLIPSDKLLNEFEDNDPRLHDNFYFTGDEYGDPANPKILTDGQQGGNSSTYKGVTMKVSWKKYTALYKLDQGGYFDRNGINCRVMRYADVFLMMAECENEAGNSAAAIEYLNKTRQRPSVDMPLYPTADYPTSTKDEIFKAIMHERYIEFAGEQVRNFDILRWRKNGKLAGMPDPISYFVANKYELLPIPLAELDGNPKIEQADQNPGY